MATLNDIITSVKQNLGNRSSGVIGGTPVDTVVLNACSKGFKNIIKQANPDYYDRMATIAITTAASTYAKPVIDVDGNTIVVKQILGARVNLLGDTATYDCQQITMQQYLCYDVQDSSITAVPRTFAYFQDKLWFVRFPDNSYTMTLAVNITPRDFVPADLNLTIAIDDIWVETVEQYATHYCFAKLQQTNDSLYWRELYEESKRLNKSVKYKQPFKKSPVSNLRGPGDPVTDPFVRRFNS